MVLGRRVSGKHGLLLGHTGAVDAGRSHLCEDLVQPLQRAVEMQLYPAGGAGHCLTPVGKERAAQCVGTERLTLLMKLPYSQCIDTTLNMSCLGWL